MSITGGQCKAARGLLGMDRHELSHATRITPRTITDFERGTRKAHASTIQAIRIALEAAGVVFIEGDDTIGPGVQLRDPEKE